jgi:hypothetical protein
MRDAGPFRPYLGRWLGRGDDLAARLSRRVPAEGGLADDEFGHRPAGHLGVAEVPEGPLAVASACSTTATLSASARAARKTRKLFVCTDDGWVTASPESWMAAPIWRAQAT